MIKKLSVGIVGGSIAGCFAAILLGRAGHTVQVFERSSRGLVGRGGGIGTPGTVLQSLIEEDLLDADFPYLLATSMPFIIRTPQHERLGYSPYQLPLNLAAFHWSALFNNLRKRVPNESYHRGKHVADARTDDTGATLVFADGSTARFDLVLFADGYQSLGRHLMFPDAELKYRGYMLWRGLYPESELDDSAPLGSSVPRLSYANSAGNFVPYFVPSEDNSLEIGHRLVNWAAYIPLPVADLPEFMVDRDGVTHVGSIPPGKMRDSEENQLKALMRENLPTFYGDIVSGTKNTYVQLIYTAQLPAYYSGRMAVIGDAGVVAPPFTGSGVFKGHTNVVDLLRTMNTESALEDALAVWSREQVRIGSRLLALGEQMEKAFIWDALDLAAADAESTAAWWKAAVTFPEEFTYLADAE